MTDEEKNETTEESTETADEAVAEAPAQESAEAAAPAQVSGGADAEPAEQLGPEERRRRARSEHSGEARPPRTIEERTAARLEKRRKNAAGRRARRATVRKRRAAAGGPKLEGTPPAERTGTGSPRIRRGVVVSDKADKTITVRIDVARQHRTYGKIVRSSSTLHAHDERNEAGAGDTVRVVESRPLSRLKRWRLVEVVERAR
jgi:small subunit ribosomal protein S17